VATLDIRHFTTLQWYTIEHNDDNIVVSANGIDKGKVNISMFHETFFCTNYDGIMFKTVIFITKYDEIVEFDPDKIKTYFTEYKINKELMMRLENRENILAYLCFIDI
jgi:hypothetical protein